MTAVARQYEITYGSAAVESVQAANGIYVLEANQPQQWITVGTVLRVYGATNVANNGTFTVTAVAGVNVTTGNLASVAEALSPARIGFPIAGTSPRVLDSQHTFDSDKDRISVSFSFVFRYALEADFLAEVDRVETIFRTPYQRFELRQNAGQPIVLDPLDSSGFNARPRIDKHEEIAANTGRSRRYHVTVEFDLPADLHVLSGRKNSGVTVTGTPNDRRRITLAGEWTATPAQPSAREAYLAGFPAFLASTVAVLGGVYGKLEETVEESPDGTDKLLRFSQTHLEILDEEGGGPLDDPDIFDPTLEISRLAPAPGDTMPSRRLGEIGVAFTAWITKGVSPKSKYDSAMRSFLIQKALGLFDASGGALVAETVNEDPHNNRLLVHLQILAQIENIARISFRATSELDSQFGTVLIPAWTGDPMSYYAFQGHRIELRVETHEERVLASAVGGGAFPGGQVPGGMGGQFGFGAFVGAILAEVGGGFGGSSGFNFGGGATGAQQTALAAQVQADFVGGAAAGAAAAAVTEVQLSDNTTSTPIRLGTQEHGLDAVDRTRKQVFQRFKPIPGSTVGVATGGGGPVAPTG